MPLLEVREFSKWFPGTDQPAVDGASFQVEPGELFGLLGPSGCGKTTLLRMIAGFETPETGSLHLHGKEITRLAPEKRGIGIVFQDYALFPHLTVADNISFALKYSPAAKTAAGKEARVKELIELLQLAPYTARFPHQLSGGQQQRVAVARALAADPAVLLLDEPFSSLDAALRDVMRTELREILKKAGINTVLVTHDQEEALSFCDRLAVMHRGQIEQVGRPEEVYLHPRTPFVAQFLGRSNLLKGLARGAVAETEFGTIPIEPQAEGEVLLSLRPEHLFLHPKREAAGDLRAQVTAREYRGHDLSFRIRLGQHNYLAHQEFSRDFQIGDEVSVELRRPAVVLNLV